MIGEIGIFVSLLLYLHQSVGGRRLRREDLEQALHDQETLNDFIASTGQETTESLKSTVAQHHKDLFEYLTELVPDLETAFNTVLAEIRLSHGALAARLDALTLPFLHLTANDLIHMPAKSPGIFGETSPSYLLDAKSGIVPFLGRTAESEEITGSWCAAQAPLAVRLYTAQGGMGKTRLFRQICNLLLADGWLTGFLKRDIEDFTAREIRFALSSPVPKLIVVDYAQEITANLCKLLRTLIDVPVTSSKTRVILLVREPGDWWAEMQSQPDGIGQLLTGIEPIPLAPLTSTDDSITPETVFTSACKAFEVQIPGTRMPTHTPDLSAPHFERVLLLQMAAFAAVNGATIEDERDLLQYVTGRERERQTALANERAVNPPKLVWQAAALATLMGGANDRNAFRETIARLPLFQQPGAPAPATVVEILHDLYPGNDTERKYVATIEPDPLGESFIAFLSDADLEEVAAVGLSTTNETILQQVVRRMGGTIRYAPLLRDILTQNLKKRFDDLAPAAVIAAIEEPEPLIGILEEIIAGGVEERTLYVLGSMMPEQTVVLAGLALLIAKANYDFAKQSGDVFYQAKTADTLALRLHAVGGLVEDVLKISQEAVNTHRQLAADNPEIYRPYLAGALNNLAIRFSELGRHSDALPFAKEALCIRSELAKVNPEIFQPDLAKSLNNLSVILSETGHPKPALRLVKEAVRIRRTLAEMNPDANLPGLAAALTNQSNRFSQLGKADKALEAANESVTICRQLALKYPDAYSSRLAGALNNLSCCYGDLGKKDKALAKSQKSVDIYRDLVAMNPVAFRSGLAVSLTNLANNLSYVGPLDDALKASQEAVDIYRELAAKTPNCYRADLAKALNVQGRVLFELKQPKDALAAFEQGTITLFPQLRENSNTCNSLLAKLIKSVIKTANYAESQPSPEVQKIINEFAAWLDAKMKNEKRIEANAP